MISEVLMHINTTVINLQLMANRDARPSQPKAFSDDRRLARAWREPHLVGLEPADRIG